MSNPPNYPPPAYSSHQKDHNTSSSFGSQPQHDYKNSVPNTQPQMSGSSDPSSQLNKDQRQYFQILKNVIITKKLQSYYTSDNQICEVVRKIDTNVLKSIASQYNMRPRSTKLLASLSLFDLIVYVDNSSSMNEGTRIDELQLISEIISDCYFPFDIYGKGLSFYFMNGDDIDDHPNIKSKDQILDIIDETLYFGETPFSTVLNSKIVSKIKRELVSNPTSARPKLLICLTDGSPTDGCSNTEILLKDVKNFLKSQHRPAGIFFQIAQIGNDLAAADFLQKLDECSSVGDIVDVTSSYENERSQVMSKGGELTKAMWVLKLLLGAIDNEFDLIDENKLN